MGVTGLGLQVGEENRGRVRGAIGRRLFGASGGTTCRCVWAPSTPPSIPPPASPPPQNPPANPQYWGSKLVDLDVRDLDASNLAVWYNRGSLGNFTKVSSVSISTVYGTQDQVGVQLDQQ